MAWKTRLDPDELVIIVGAAVVRRDGQNLIVDAASETTIRKEPREPGQPDNLTEASKSPELP